MYSTDLMQRRNCARVRVKSHASASAITRECEHHHSQVRAPSLASASAITRECE